MLESKIQSDTLMAMKNSDKFKVSVLRMLKSAIQAEKINAKNELTDENIIAIIKKVDFFLFIMPPLNNFLLMLYLIIT